MMMNEKASKAISSARLKLDDVAKLAASQGKDEDERNTIAALVENVGGVFIDAVQAIVEQLATKQE